jgi:hypothetical protein
MTEVWPAGNPNTVTQRSSFSLATFRIGVIAIPVVPDVVEVEVCDEVEKGERGLNWSPLRVDGRTFISVVGGSNSSKS